MTPRTRNIGLATRGKRTAVATSDGLAILLVWLTCVVLTFFVEPNYDNTSVQQRLYYTVYNVAIGWLIGFHLLDRLARGSIRFFAALSCIAAASGTLVNEALVEPYVFRTGPINVEGVYYGLVDSATTVTLFLLLRLARLLRDRKQGAAEVAVAPWTGPAPPSPADDGDRFFVRMPGGTRRISAADVIYMKAERDFTHIVCSTGSHFASESLKDLLAKSARFGFVRVHKSFAVNLRRVDRLTRTEAGLGDRQVPVGRRYWRTAADAWRQGRASDAGED